MPSMTAAQRNALIAARSEKQPRTSAEAYAQMDRMLAASAQMTTLTARSANGKPCSTGRKSAA